MDKAIFELGEKKYVCISVRSTCEKPFDVTSAKYILKNGDEKEKTLANAPECNEDYFEVPKTIG